MTITTIKANGFSQQIRLCHTEKELTLIFSNNEKS